MHLYTSTRYNTSIDFIEVEEEGSEEEDPTLPENPDEPEIPEDEPTTVAEGEEVEDDEIIEETTKDEDYLMSDVIIDNLIAITNTEIPTQLTTTPKVKIIDSIVNYYETPKLTIKTIELPLYRDGNGMKHFTLGFKQGANEIDTTQTCISVIRVIGYRA